MSGGFALAAELRAALLAGGPRQVVAKRGTGGVLLFGDAGPLQVARFRVEVMNTLGAGDAFGAGFCYGLLQGWPLPDVLAFANAAGAIVASRHACADAMPTRAEVLALMASQGRALQARRRQPAHPVDYGSPPPAAALRTAPAPAGAPPTPPSPGAAAR